MKKLRIKTRYHITVQMLLLHFQMIEKHYDVEDTKYGIAIDYPDDAISQGLAFWFALAQGCGLIDSYELT